LTRNEGPNFSEKVIHGYIDPASYIFNDKPDNYFLYLARVEDNYAKQKGLELCLQLQDRLKFNLKIAGPGPGEKYVREGVEYVGPVWGQEKAELISNAKALFSMTLYPEPFGYIVIESLLSGTPVIATDHGAFPETIPNDVGFRGVFWKDFEEAITNIDSIDRYRCRDYALKHFSLRQQYKKYVKFFEQIIYHSPRGWYG
jgi:glycosyltransferase involved in cell wall biosynthesis